MDPDTLMDRARQARERAYAPYSGFRVGAAVEVADGSVFTAGNVENASYGLTICAERAAVFAAVASGHTRLRAVAVATDGPDPVAPCGACRQVLAEFAEDLPVYSTAGDRRMTWSLETLLPARFDGPVGAGDTHEH